MTGDAAMEADDGYYRILGRIDDVINVSGHRLGTKEIESAAMVVSAKRARELSATRVRNSARRSLAATANASANQRDIPTPPGHLTTVVGGQNHRSTFIDQRSNMFLEPVLTLRIEIRACFVKEQHRW